MEALTSRVGKNVKLTAGGLLIATGLLFMMFHIVLFPVIGVVIGIPWIGAGVFSALRSRGGAAENDVCSPDYAWQPASCQ